MKTALKKSTPHFAPILLFCYKRLEVLKETVDSLLKNPECIDSDLYIFSDGYKNESDREAVESVRNFIKQIEGFKSVNVIADVINKGLATSIISGVNRVFESFDRVIVMEDDLITSSNFLAFMNHYLVQYEYEDNIFSISGYSFDLGRPKDYAYEIYFINRGWSWGWATWKDRWQTVDWNVSDYQSFLNNSKAQAEFAKGGSDLNAMLRKQMTHKLDSWAIRWFYQQYKNKALSVYPIVSKVTNNGFDNDATHTFGSTRRYETFIDRSENIVFHSPPTVKITDFFQRSFQKKMGIKARIISKLETMIKKIL